MSFPFLFLAAALMLGIFLSSLLGPDLQVSLIVMAVFLPAAWIGFFLKKFRLAFVLILISLMAAGAGIHTHQDHLYSSNALGNFRADQYADFTGRLSRSPSRGLDRDTLVIEVEKVGYSGRDEELRGTLQITIPHSSESPKIRSLLVGDRIKISAQMSRRLESFQNFRPSVSKRYMRIRKIHNKAFSKSPLLVEKLESRRDLSPERMISRLRQTLQDKIEKHFQREENSLSEEGAVMEALILGERDRMPDTLTRSLQTAGLFHLFAISGAHIGIITFLIFSFFRLIRLPPRLSFGLLMAFLVFYALLVEGRPSVFRATVMALAYLGGKLIWSQVNPLNTLSLSAFIILLLNPLQLFSLGFQLTFSATLCIVLFFPKIMKFLPRLPLRLSELFALSLTAYLGVMPLIASSFNRITFSSLLLNLAAVPLVGSIMAGGYIFLFAAFVFPLLAGILAGGLKILIQALAAMGHFPDIVPFITFRIPTPHILTVIFYFLFLLSFLLPSMIKKQKIISTLGFMAVSLVLITHPFIPRVRSLTVTFLDVGQGESILVEFPGRKKMLVDGGGFYDDSYDIGENVVSPFLWDKGIKTIELLVLTHAHPDHLNGLKSISRNFRIREFWEAYSPAENPTYTAVKNTLKKKSAVRKRVFRGHTVIVSGVKIEVLHPAKQEPLVRRVHNDQSIVMRISGFDFSLLLTGDIGKDSEKDILDSAEILDSQVLKSPHHGSLSSSSPAFLEAVDPDMVIISVGNRNFYGLPDPQVLQRYRAAGAYIFRTDSHGAIEVTVDEEHSRILTAVQIRPFQPL